MVQLSTSRTRYLTLALAVRKALDSLVTLVEDGREDPELKRRLKELLESLKTSRGERSVFAPLQNHRSFGHYEQIRTIDEAVKERGPHLEETFAALLDSSAPIKQRQEQAFEAIDFLQALESRALRHYNQPVRSRIG
jgi:hypothetical protein